MALPVEISTVTMTATLVDDQGDPLQGIVTLTPSVAQVVSATTDRIIELHPRSIRLDEYGALSTPMIPSDEADIQPHGIVWSLALPGDSQWTLQFVVPSDVTTADISQYVIASHVNSEPQYLIGYRGPKGDKGDTGPQGPGIYNDAPLSARVTALETAGFLRRLVYNGSSYPTRPVGVAAGLVEYVGPAEPTDWLTGDTWVEQV